MNEKFNPKIAGILAIFLGYTGAHKFYTGDFKNGFIRAIAFYFAYVFGWPLVTFILFIMGVAEGIKLLKSSNESSNTKLSDSYLGKRIGLEDKQNKEQGNIYLGEGIASYKEFEYEKAKEYFEKAFVLTPNDSRVNFNLACTYSMLEEVDKCIFHLNQAIESGYPDQSNIFKHDGLSYIRTTQEFEKWQKNIFHSEVYDEPNEDKVDLLEQLRILREAKENGKIDDEDYEKQRIELLGRN